MADMAREFLIRVRPSRDGAFTASIRQFCGTHHPEVRCVIGPVTLGHGANELAAIVAAVANMRVGQDVREVSRVD